MTGNSEKRAARRLFVALDFPAAGEALVMARRLAPLGVGFKIGLELFTAEGPVLLAEFARHFLGSAVFLDLKFHDIPATVAGAVRSTACLGADLINLHLSGGEEMVRAAVAARDEFLSGGAKRGRPRLVENQLVDLGVVGEAESSEEPQDLVAGAELEQEDYEERKPALVRAPLLLGVTVLTSMDGDDLRAVWGDGVAADPSAHALRLAERARDWGLDGVVASARESAAIRAACGPEFLIVTPDIRPAGAASRDQKPLLTPAEALSAGSSHLVVGRPVTRAEDPGAACAAILAEMAEVLR